MLHSRKLQPLSTEARMLFRSRTSYSTVVLVNGCKARNLQRHCARCLLECTSVAATSGLPISLMPLMAHERELNQESGLGLTASNMTSVRAIGILSGGRLYHQTPALQQNLLQSRPFHLSVPLQRCFGSTTIKENDQHTNMLDEVEKNIGQNFESDISKETETHNQNNFHSEAHSFRRTANNSNDVRRNSSELIDLKSLSKAKELLRQSMKVDVSSSTNSENVLARPVRSYFPEKQSSKTEQKNLSNFDSNLINESIFSKYEKNLKSRTDKDELDRETLKCIRKVKLLLTEDGKFDENTTRKQYFPDKSEEDEPKEILSNNVDTQDQNHVDSSHVNKEQEAILQSNNFKSLTDYNDNNHLHEEGHEFSIKSAKHSDFAYMQKISKIPSENRDELFQENNTHSNNIESCNGDNDSDINLRNHEIDIKKSVHFSNSYLDNATKTSGNTEVSLSNFISDTEFSNKSSLFSKVSPFSPANTTLPNHRHMPRTGNEMMELMNTKVVSPPDSRHIRVALLGLPNSGKSTLVNALSCDRVCSVSRRVHTTRCLARAVTTIDNTQIVILDTPGIVTPDQVLKHDLEASLVNDSEHSIAEADVILIVLDSYSRYTRQGLHPRMLRLLALYPNIPAVLVLNKVDRVKEKRKLLEMTRLLTDGVVGGESSHIVDIPLKQNPLDKSLSQEDTIEKLLNYIEDKKSNVSQTIEKAQDQALAIDDYEDENETNCVELSFDHFQKTKPFKAHIDKRLLKKYGVSRDIKEEDVFSGNVKLTEEEVNNFVKDRKGWPLFERVMLTSALDGVGVEELRQLLLDLSLPGPWDFPSNYLTDQDPFQVVLSTVREKFMDRLRHQLSYTLKFSIENWEVTEADSLKLLVTVLCEKESMISLLVGGGGCHITKLVKQAEDELVKTFKTEVQLRLNVISKESAEKDKNRRGR